MEVYRTLYPSLHTPDALEIATFAKLLEEKFGLDVDHLPQREYTLGDLFALTHPQTI